MQSHESRLLLADPKSSLASKTCRASGIGCGDLVHADDARSGPRPIRWGARQPAPRASPRDGSGDPAAVAV